MGEFTPLPTEHPVFSQLQDTIDVLRAKRIAEGRSHQLHDLLTASEETAVGQLLGTAVLGGKDSINAIYTYFAAVRYCLGVDPVTLSQEELVNYTQENFDLLLSTVVERNLSKNVGQRALPILAMLAEAGVTDSLAVVELGSSVGLIGRALVANRSFLGSLDEHCLFPVGFDTTIKTHPVHGHKFNIVSYLGIDLFIPDDAWNLACIEEPEMRERTRKFAVTFPPSPAVKLAQGSAFGFSQLPEVAEMFSAGNTPVVLTSMVKYQLTIPDRGVLGVEIADFLTRHNGLEVVLDYDQAINRFVGYLQGYGSRTEKVGLYVFRDGDCMAWGL